jgi:hypothetical protein
LVPEVEPPNVGNSSFFFFFLVDGAFLFQSPSGIGLNSTIVSLIKSSFDSLMVGKSSFSYFFHKSK